ncbi:MAG: DUF11 domain-containing protein [Romboutsia sp.]|uniref:DUF11 domain-containing protein n=1 Tax=Romboutsia sp. TaxID=1965302 RepID=UPI003F38B383
MINLQIIKSANKNYLFPQVCNLIRFSITIENLGDETAYRIAIRNVLSKDLYFIPGTLYINGIKQLKSCSISPIYINSLAPGENISINYDIEFNDLCALNEIQDAVAVSYFDLNNIKYSVSNDDLIIPIIRLNICVSKTVDKKCACIGETINYSIIIRNFGNIPIDNVIFYDDLPFYLSLAPASVLINGVAKYIESFAGGLPIGTINPNVSVVISFNVQILNTIDTCDILNTAYIGYSYSIQDGSVLNSSIGETTSCTVCTKLSQGSC